MANKANRKTVKRGAKKAVVKKVAKKVAIKVTNKVAIGVLVLALVFTGAASAYAFQLGGKIDALGKQWAASQEQQAAQISALQKEIVTLRGEALDKIKTLDSELNGIATEIDQSVINAGELYQGVSQSTVRITDGERVLGSGFAFDANGHILTPNHVVAGQSQLYIISADGHTSPAIVIGTCEYSDIAVLKQNLSIPALKLADSTKVKIGEPVIVIGSPTISSPLGLTGTITSGIVSQTNRYVAVAYNSGTSWVANLIQFNAAINSGNSGSPLLNSKGEVIGMAIAGVNPSLGSGIYYAISANKLTRVASSIIERGSFDYPWLGVATTDLTPKTAIDRGLETVNGTLVSGVMPATPAASAGIMADDIIVGINGVPVRQTADLTCYLGEYATPGDKVTLTLIRYGVKIGLPIEVGKR